MCIWDALHTVAIKYTVYSGLCSHCVCYFSAEENTAVPRLRRRQATHSLNCCTHLYKWPINVLNTVTRPCICAVLPDLWPCTHAPPTFCVATVGTLFARLRLHGTAALVIQADSAHTILLLSGYTRHLMLRDDTEYKQPFQAADWFTGHMLSNKHQPFNYSNLAQLCIFVFL